MRLKKPGEARRNLQSHQFGFDFTLVFIHMESCFKTAVEWRWDVQDGDDFVDAFNDDRDVTFHRKHSSGTAVVRGTQPMSHGQHFWEIEMLSPVYGTDMMVGIGTAEADMTQLQNIFISRLGNDSHTWGFSYTGSFYHNGEGTIISNAFDQGSVIGLHLDMWNGTLSFYKNKRHLGVASKGLKGKTIYAMASSTAACSTMRLLRSCSFPSSLQFLCCARLRELVPNDKCVLNELDVPPGLKHFLESNLQWLLSPRFAENHPHRKNNLQEMRWWDSSAGGSHQSSDVNFVIVSGRGIPYSFFNRFKRHVRPPPVNNESVDIATPASFVSATDQLDSPSDEETDDNETKRRRYSYNYVMGLSDPDSDVEHS